MTHSRAPRRALHKLLPKTSQVFCASLLCTSLAQAQADAALLQELEEADTAPAAALQRDLS